VILETTSHCEHGGFMSRFVSSLFLILVLIGAPVQARAAQTLAGPFSFEVLQVIDGDTFRARVPIWLDQTVTVKIRLSGVDTPEMKGKCPAETARAKLARDFAIKWLQQDDLRWSMCAMALMPVVFWRLPKRLMGSAFRRRFCKPSWRSLIVGDARNGAGRCSS
jgi:hypothetical protein